MDINRTILTGLLTCVYVLLASWCVQAAELVVDVSQREGTFRNIAGGINFWGHEEAQKRFISEIGTHLYRLKIRLHRVKREGDGYRNFPWEGDDLALGDMKEIVRNIRVAKKRGCRVMLQIYGMPAWLSVSGDPTVVTNGLPNYAKYPPRDHDEWAKLVSATIVRLRSLGLDDIDCYEVFGEPNVGSTWYGRKMPCRKNRNGKKLVHACKPNDLGHNTVQVLEEFFKVYEATVKGIRQVDADAEIGGIAVTPNPSGIWWTRFFAEYVRSRELPLAFYSWHSYGTDESLARLLSRIGSKNITVDWVRRFFDDRLRRRGFGELEINRIVIDLYAYLKDLQKENKKALSRPYTFMSDALRRILNEEGLESTKLFLTEWNVSHGVDRRHDTHYGASFITRGLIDITDSETRAQTLYVLSNKSLSNHDGRFWGFFGLFSLGETLDPKASFNAFRLFSMLGEGADRVKVNLSGDDVYAIAAYDGTKLSLLMTYYTMAEKPNYSLRKGVSINITGMPFSSYAYKTYRIDKTHANSYYGNEPELEVVENGKGKGDFKRKVNLPVYGVMMIRIEGLRK